MAGPRRQPRRHPLRILADALLGFGGLGTVVDDNASISTAAWFGGAWRLGGEHALHAQRGRAHARRRAGGPAAGSQGLRVAAEDAADPADAP